MKTDYTGKRYGRLVVLGDGDDITSPNGSCVRTFVCMCDCGNITEVRHSAVCGTTKSCGCLNEENRPLNGLTHGGSGTRLHRCWKSMKTRCRKRKDAGDNCNYYPEWVDYIKFKDWAMSNGYDDDFVLCRNGDIGDYVPGNCRWDTQEHNTQESNSKNYTVINPDGVIITLNNMSKFSRDNNLSLRGMFRIVGYGGNYEGWTCPNPKHNIELCNKPRKKRTPKTKPKLFDGMMHDSSECMYISIFETIGVSSTTARKYINMGAKSSNDILKLLNQSMGNVSSSVTKSNIRRTGKSLIMKTKECPHCGMVGKGGNMTRYHFDKCKHREV